MGARALGGIAVFITLEGPEGGGKSTVLRMLQRFGEGKRVVRTREPGDGPLGMQIRNLLLHGEGLDPTTELFLFLADRAQHVASVIRPALEENAIVVCDRFTDSTIVYQGYGRGLDLKRLRDLNEAATGGLKPDLTILFDIPPDQGLLRQTTQDRMDREPLDFHELIREGFLQEAKREPGRWVVVDATQPIEKVLERCEQVIAERLPR